MHLRLVLDVDPQQHARRRMPAFKTGGDSLRRSRGCRSESRLRRPEPCVPMRAECISAQERRKPRGEDGVAMTEKIDRVPRGGTAELREDGAASSRRCARGRATSGTWSSIPASTTTPRCRRSSSTSSASAHRTMSSAWDREPTAPRRRRRSSGSRPCSRSCEPRGDGRPRRRQLDACRSAGGSEARHTDRASRGRATQLRSDDARGDQSGPDRSAVDLVLHPQPGGRARTSYARGSTRERSVLRREHDDRHAREG